LQFQLVAPKPFTQLKAVTVYNWKAVDTNDSMKISRTKTSVISAWVPQNPLVYTTTFYVTWLTNMQRLESRRFVIVHMLHGSLKSSEQIRGKRGKLNASIDEQIYQKMPKVSQLTTNSVVIS